MGVSVEELVKLAAQDKNELPKTYLNDVHRFITSLKIKEGERVVKSLILYKAYTLWASKPMPSNSFHKLFGQFFDSKRSRTFSYYSLNYRTIELLNRIDNSKLEKHGKEK